MMNNGQWGDDERLWAYHVAQAPHVSNGVVTVVLVSNEATAVNPAEKLVTT